MAESQFPQTKNSFEGALNTDVSPDKIEANQYTSALNLSLVTSGRFGALQNIQGTTTVDTIAPNLNRKILGIFANKYKIGLVENVNCLTIITATIGGDFNIYCNDLDNTVLYELFSGALPADYFDIPKTVDGVSYAESGLDILYFTDNYFGIRKLRCEIPTGYTPNFLTETDIGLSRRAAIGDIALADITTGGSLLTGTYQIAYQLIDPVKNQFTGFSLLTSPIHVYTTINSNIFAGIGLSSNKQILLDITPTSEELANYTHFRVAIVENVFPEGTEAAELSNVGLSKVELISDYESGGVIVDYPISSNVQTETTTIDEIVVDLAAIERVKTIDIVGNRLVAGNVTFKDLDYDNGTPEISGGSIIKQVGSNDSFSSDVFTSRYKGHFRGEVYRYAISYFDEFGNFSQPSTLDVSSVTDNQIPGALIDMQFPQRYEASGTCTIMDSSNNTRSLGLHLDNIDNHPTWARGFVILRAKRKKNILFQSPMIPMMPYIGIGAVGTYPNITREGASAGANVSYPNATPMGPGTTHFPNNLFYGRDIGMKLFSSNTGTGANKFLQGEVYLAEIATAIKNVMLFPDATIYTQNNKVAFTNSESVHRVDAAICRLFVSRFDSTSYNVGQGVDTSVSGSFFASLDGDYYFDDGNAKTDIDSGTYFGQISDTKSFDNYAVGDNIGGESVFDTTKLITGGIGIGYPPNTQRCTVAKLSGSYTALGALTFVSGAPTQVSVTGGALDNNTFITSSAGLFGSYVNKIAIVNVLANLDASRYGDPSDYNEFIYTGTKIVFTTGELPTVASGASLPKDVDIWGGDCIVSPHCFKVSDTVYSVVNQEKIQGAGNGTSTEIPRWGKVWLTDITPDAVLTTPIALKAAAQYLTIVLESEYHGSIRDVDTNEFVGTYNFPIKGAVTEPTSRTNLTYNNNINLAKQNDQKIFVPLDPNLPILNEFPARVYYSDVKVYQSSIEGFNAIRVGSFIDTEERYGGITKLILSGTNLYSLQSNAISYIPFEERVLELTDASQLGVRSGGFLSTPLYLTNVRGCQHIRTVRSNGSGFYFADNFNKAVYFINSPNFGEANIISNAGLISKTRDLSGLGTTLPEDFLFGVYDSIRGEYWLVNRPQVDFCYVFNEKVGKWTGTYSFGEEVLWGGVMAGNTTYANLYLIGIQGSDFVTATMYTGNTLELFGIYYPAYVDFVINPMPEISKVFDNVFISASNHLDTMDLNLEKEGTIGNQVINGIDIDITSRGEGNFRAKIGKDSSRARARGLFATARFNWKTGALNPQTTLYGVVTQFRPSY